MYEITKKRFCFFVSPRTVPTPDHVWYCMLAPFTSLLQYQTRLVLFLKKNPLYYIHTTLEKSEYSPLSYLTDAGFTNVTLIEREYVKNNLPFHIKIYITKHSCSVYCKITKNFKYLETDIKLKRSYSKYLLAQLYGVYCTFFFKAGHLVFL